MQGLAGRIEGLVSDELVRLPLAEYIAALRAELRAAALAKDPELQLTGTTRPGRGSAVVLITDRLGLYLVTRT